jgi:hypothetical protein
VRITLDTGASNVMATVAPPWGLVALTSTSYMDACEMQTSQCVIGSGTARFAATTTDPNAGPRNVTLTEVAATTTCP